LQKLFLRKDLKFSPTESDNNHSEPQMAHSEFSTVLCPSPVFLKLTHTQHDLLVPTGAVLLILVKGLSLMSFDGYSGRLCIYSRIYYTGKSLLDVLAYVTV